VFCSPELRINEEKSQNDEDEWTEDEADICADVTDTLLTPPDFGDHNEQQCILNLATELSLEALHILKKLREIYLL